jgi:pimeloyl-ACP methyl ester carboxylesterase
LKNLKKDYEKPICMETSEKPTLLCLHGALGSAAQLQAALAPLAAHVNLLFFDFPGHGSRSAEPLTLAGCIAATREFILENQLVGTTIFGYSMGGYMALLLAKQYPELVGQIITLGTKLAWNPHFSAEEVQKLNPEIIEQKVPKYAVALQQWHGDAWKKVLAGTAELMLDLGANPRLNDDVYQRLQHPVLLCLADSDTMVTREETIHAAWLLPHGEFAEIANSGHAIEKVDVGEVRTTIKL